MLPESRVNVSFDLSFTTRPGLRRALTAAAGRLRPRRDPPARPVHGPDVGDRALRATPRRPDAAQHPHPAREPVRPVPRRVPRPRPTMVKPMMRAHRPRLVVMDTYMEDYITDRYAGAFRDLVPIPVGVDPGLDARRRRRAGPRAWRRADVPLILSVGHVIPLRDRVGVVEALPEVLATRPDARLAVIGRVYYPLFLQRAEELGVAHAVLSPGAVPKSDIPHLLAAADVECHEQGDGLGTATLESMAAGVPVVGWGRHDNFPGFDLVEGEGIHLAPRGDVHGLATRLLKVLGEPEARAASGASATPGRGRALRPGAGARPAPRHPRRPRRAPAAPPPADSLRAPSGPATAPPGALFHDLARDRLLHRRCRLHRHARRADAAGEGLQGPHLRQHVPRRPRGRGRRSARATSS